MSDLNNSGKTVVTGAFVPVKGKAQPVIIGRAARVKDEEKHAYNLYFDMFPTEKLITVYPKDDVIYADWVVIKYVESFQKDPQTGKPKRFLQHIGKGTRSTGANAVNITLYASPVDGHCQLFPVK